MSQALLRRQPDAPAAGVRPQPGARPRRRGVSTLSRDVPPLLWPRPQPVRQLFRSPAPDVCPLVCRCRRRRPASVVSAECRCCRGVGGRSRRRGRRLRRPVAAPASTSFQQVTSPPRLCLLPRWRVHQCHSDKSIVAGFPRLLKRPGMAFVKFQRLGKSRKMSLVLEI